jgi:cell division septation protein DedD
MDSAMRDLDQLRERSSDQSRGRRLGLFALAWGLSLTATVAMALVLQGSDTATAKPEPDPLAALLLASEPAAPPSTPAPEIRPESLTFPARLLDRDDAVVEATVRAAEAEHRALGGVETRQAELERGRASGSAREQNNEDKGPGPAGAGLTRGEHPIDLPTPSVADLPAAGLAASDNEHLARVARHDPMVAEALPTGTGERAPVGHEGAYTLQVVSYEQRKEAEVFASALRARGHRAFVAQADVPERGRFYRVRVGPFSTRHEARAYQDRFEEAEHMRTILVSNKDK